MSAALGAIRDDELARWLTEDVPAAIVGGGQIPARHSALASPVPRARLPSLRHSAAAEGLESARSGLEAKMVNRTLVGLLLAALGIALVVISALADHLEIGTHGFGWKQTFGVIAGVVLAVAGAGLAAVRSNRSGLS
jgi:hypothetical protein